MNWKRSALIAALAAVTIFSAFRVYRAYSFVSMNPPDRPNVLIVSVCSFSARFLSLYGALNKDGAPNLEKFFDDANFVFANAFNGMGWTNINNFTMANVTPDTFLFNLYDSHGPIRNNHLWRVPQRRVNRRIEQADGNNDFEKDYKPSLDKVEKMIRGPHVKPFFAVVHVKYLHYPLIDRFNSDSGWDRFLSPDEKNLVVEYLTYPEKYYHKLSFLLLLANNPYHVLVHPKFKKMKWGNDRKKLREILGLMINPDILAEWKASEGFDKDLVILEKIYRANVLYLDKILGPLLNLWGDTELRKNTILMFAADHGEAHMERGELTHGMSLWDPMLHVPVAIRFPGSHRREVIEDQVDYVALSRTLNDLINGARSPAPFRAALEKHLPEAIIARNCMNDIRGIRYKNKYKYFVSLRDGGRYLFDLEKDPQELQNIAESHPAEVAEMEALYWQNLKSIGNVDTNNCLPTIY